MNRLILVLAWLLSGLQLYGQADTLNKLDADGKKTGWWLTYLDKNLEVLKDSSDATHSMYNYYYRNKFLYRYGEGYGSKKIPMEYPDDESMKIGKYKLLDGEYVTKYDNGNLRSVLSASKGILIDFKTYFPNGQLKFKVTYAKECGAPKQHCLKEYNEDGSVKYEGHTWLPKKAE